MSSSRLLRSLVSRPHRLDQCQDVLYPPGGDAPAQVPDRLWVTPAHQVDRETGMSAGIAGRPLRAGRPMIWCSLRYPVSGSGQGAEASAPRASVSGFLGIALRDMRPPPLFEPPVIGRAPWR